MAEPITRTSQHISPTLTTVHPRIHPPSLASPASIVRMTDSPRTTPTSFWNKKTSLDFICSPTTPASPSRKKLPHRLDTLPRDLLSNIGYHVAMACVETRGRPHPSALLPLLLTSRSIHDALAFDLNPKLYNRLFRATFDHAALTRRYAWMASNLQDLPGGKGRNIFDLFADPKSWAFEYKDRWATAKRMRAVSLAGIDEIPGVCDREKVVADTWTVWFLITEDDGKNIPFLAEECDVHPWFRVLYRTIYLKSCMVPGYPSPPPENGLPWWCAMYSRGCFQKFQADTPKEEVDERIFLFRPFVFACAKYEADYAPVSLRRLPICKPGCTEHEPDESMKSRAIPYRRFGYTWRRAPPQMYLAAILYFLRLLESQPAQAGDRNDDGTTHPTEGLFSVNRLLPSIYHDREWQRNSVCQDPHTSPGLPPLTFRGEIQGFWRAKFLFYDFDAYRRILNGDMRGVYTGTFAEQVAETELEETVIKVRLEDVGGKGSLLYAGFDDETVDGSEEEQERIRSGYGHELCLDENAPDEPGWTKEILISGRFRSAWGWAKVRGRVRSWDGLICLSITYNNSVMGRWLWRGYIHPGGVWIGRWRDTFTPEDMRGYEGPCAMIRAGDPLYPPSYPTSMADSAGPRTSGTPFVRSPPGSRLLPPESLLVRPVTIARQRAEDQRRHHPQQGTGDQQGDNTRVGNAPTRSRLPVAGLSLSREGGSRTSSISSEPLQPSELPGHSSGGSGPRNNISRPGPVAVTGRDNRLRDPPPSEFRGLHKWGVAEGSGAALQMKSAPLSSPGADASYTRHRPEYGQGSGVAHAEHAHKRHAAMDAEDPESDNTLPPLRSSLADPEHSRRVAESMWVADRQQGHDKSRSRKRSRVHSPQGSRSVSPGSRRVSVGSNSPRSPAGPSLAKGVVDAGSADRPTWVTSNVRGRESALKESSVREEPRPQEMSSSTSPVSLPATRRNLWKDMK